MNKQRMIFTLCIVALAAGVFAFGKQAQISQPMPKQLSTAQIVPETEPEYIIYGFLFRNVVTLNEKALERERQGQDGREFRSLYQQEAKLNEAQTRALNKPPLLASKK